MKVAVVDGGSFVLPYDTQLVAALAAQGIGVDFHGSRTRYNGALLETMRRLPGVAVFARAVSGSVAPRWRGGLAYLALLLGVWRRRANYDAINVQFSALWWLERPFFSAWRDKLVFTVHNPVPHGFAGRAHGPTLRIAELARSLVFVSRFSHDDFIARYGERFRAKSRVLEHGLLPVEPGLAPVAYGVRGQPEALVYWSTVKPYKGIELFAELARSERFRATGLKLEIHGAWAPELRGLRDEIRGLGVSLDDGFVGTPELLRLLARDVVFLLPYREASQSGALFTLLHHGRVFVCADVGELGGFMRRFGLEALLLKERSAAGVLACLEALALDPAPIARALQAAQDASAWAVTAADIAGVYETIAPLRRPPIP